MWESFIVPLLFIVIAFIPKPKKWTYLITGEHF
jgi:hypothetical protein